MKRRNRSSISLGRAATVCGAFLASSCATLVSPGPDLLVPLDQALAGDLSQLTSAAEGGDPQAQLAMSIVAAHGLRGRPADPRQAATWRSQALAQRRVTPITQYTAAFNGQPSRVNIIHVPVSAIPLGQIAVIDRCLASLKTRAAASMGVCGDTPESEAARRMAWASAQP